MPSVITHAVVGSALSTLAPQRYRGFRLAAVLAIAAALPDADVLAFRFGVPYGDPLGHRGLTHSLLFALVLATGLWTWLSRGSPRISAPSLGLFALTLIASASHGFLDAFTDAGLGVGFLLPFSDTRYFFPWRPILTSPLRIGRFLSAEGIAILRNEALWVWLPTGVLLGLAISLRYIAGRTARGGTKVK